MVSCSAPCPFTYVRYIRTGPVLTPPVVFQTTGFHFVIGPVLHHRFYIKQLVLSFSLSPNMYGTSEPVPYYTTGSISNNWFSLCDRSPITPPVLYSTTGFLFYLCPLICTVHHNRFCFKQPVFIL